MEISYSCNQISDYYGNKSYSCKPAGCLVSFTFVGVKLECEYSKLGQCTTLANLSLM